MDKKHRNLRQVPKIVNDKLSLMLWSRCVLVTEENDLATMESLHEELQKTPFPGSTDNTILKRMHKDGAGFDGLNAAMITYGYLQNICLYFINKAKKK